MVITWQPSSRLTESKSWARSWGRLQVLKRTARRHKANRYTWQTLFEPGNDQSKAGLFARRVSKHDQTFFVSQMGGIAHIFADFPFVYFSGNKHIRASLAQAAHLKLCRRKSR